MTNAGFVCCGVRTAVKRTVNPCAGRVVRYRKWPKCGRNVVTVERAVTDHRRTASD